jgi:2-phospho-L-lactate/phosphoenolpyruvate guanylyltransferase
MNLQRAGWRNLLLMKTVLLPVKDFQHAKQRLACALDAETRANLARAMLSDVLDALSHAQLPDTVIVFTASGEAGQMARSCGFDVVTENSVAGHSAAVNLMVSELVSHSSRILSIAGDLPKLRPEEVDLVLNTAAAPITVLPSRDGTGTNGILFLPPARIEMEYGESSFERHMTKAFRAGHRADVMKVPGIEFDIDTPEDLQAFLDNPRTDGATWRYLISRQ